MRGKKWVGINVNDINFRFVLLIETAKEIIIENAFFIKEPKEIYEEGRIVDFNTLTNLFRSVRNEMGRKKTIITFQDREYVCRVINLPKMTDKELKSAIKHEITKFTDIDNLESHTIDHITYKGKEEISKDKTETHFVVAHNDDITNNILLSMEYARLHPYAVETIHTSVVRSCHALLREKKSCIVIDISMNRSEIYAITSNFPFYVRNSEISYKDIIYKLSVELGTEMDIMGKINREVGFKVFDKEFTEDSREAYALEEYNIDINKYREALTEIANDINKEITTTYNFIFSRVRKYPTNIIIVGNVAGLRGLDVFLTYLSNIKTDYWHIDKVTEIRGKEVVNLSGEDLDHTFAISIGSTLRGVLTDD